MSRMGWIIILVAAGVGLAVVIGILGTRNEPSTSKTEAVSSLCSSLNSLETSIKGLTSLSSSASKTVYENDITAVQDDWNQVKSDAQAVQNAPTGDLDSAWDSFSSAVKNVPNDASVQDAVKDVTQSAEQLASAAQSTAAQVNCLSPSTPTTTSS
jgi:predicted Zn-dependent protease